MVWRRLQATTQPQARRPPQHVSAQRRLAQEQKRDADAVALYQKALDAWSAAEKSPRPDVATLLGPRLDTAAIHYQLGLLEYARRQYEAAISHLDPALKASPTNSYAIFLRARSKEALRLNQPAMT